MRLTLTAELDISLGSGGCWYEVEIDCNYIPGVAGDRLNPPEGDDVEAISFRVREPIGRPVNGKWRMTPWAEPDAGMTAILDRALDKDWLLGEARDVMRAEADDCWEDVA